MPDISHTWGGDLDVSPSGDLLAADGVERAKQRILRRLMTNLGDYIWQPDYGAGLPGAIGDTGTDRIVAAIRSQLMAETVIAKSPLPVIAVQAIDSGVFVRIEFQNALTGVQDTLQFNYTV